MLIVIIFLANAFFGKDAIEGTIYGSIKGMVGDSAAIQIQDIIKNAAISDGGTLAGIIGVVTLVIGATTVFSEMQDSLNTMWGLKVKCNQGWMRMVISRLMSFSVVVSLGFLLLVSLVINGLLEGFMDNLQEMFPSIAVIIIYGVNLVVTLFVVSFLFAIIFKVLPDAVISWKDVTVGAVFTAVLFMIGKFGIMFYINRSNMGVLMAAPVLWSSYWFGCIILLLFYTSAQSLLKHMR